MNSNDCRKYQQEHDLKDFNATHLFFNPFTTTDRFRLIQNNEWKSPLKLLSVERVKLIKATYMTPSLLED